MKQYLALTLAAFIALAGCTELSDQDKALLNSTRAMAQDAKSQAAQAADQARQAQLSAAQSAATAMRAQQSAAQSAAEAQAASQRADRVFRQSEVK
jgi:hypothetical protein